MYARRTIGAVRAPLVSLRRSIVAAAAVRLDPRTRLAHRYLRGNGIEIGALSGPLPVPRSARVRYTDRLSVAELRAHYPELGDADFVEPDIIDDGEVLASIPDGSLDFVAASHFIEHCEDPVGTIANHLRKLRDGGILFLVVPDKRATFDATREVTPLEHLVRDHEQGPLGSRRRHYEEWVRDVNAISDGVHGHVERLMEQRYSIHFHVWTPASFLELVRYCADELEFPLELETFEHGEAEFFVVLSKREAQAATRSSTLGTGDGSGSSPSSSS